MNFVADAGKENLESSSSVSEVVTRLREHLQAVGLDGCSLDADLSSLVLSYWRADLPVPIITMRDVSVGSPRLHRLSGAVALLDRVERGEVTVGETYAELDRLRADPGARTRFEWSALLMSWRDRSCSCTGSTR